MRVILIALLGLSAVIAADEPAAAERRPWCLRTGGTGPTGGLNDCSFQTLEQCRASIGGGGDQCLRNPDLEWDRLEGRTPRRPVRQPRSGGD